MKHLSLLGVVLWIVSLGLNVQAQDNPAQPTDTSAEAKADKPAATKDEAAKNPVGFILWAIAAFSLRSIGAVILNVAAI